MSILKEDTVNSSASRSRASLSASLDENCLALLALALTPNVGPKRIVDAIAGLSSPAQIFALTLTELEGLRLPADAAQFIFDGKARRAADDEAEQLLKQNATLITLSSSE